MTVNQIASKIAKLEGKKSQARIGDIREILKILVRIDAEYRAYELDPTRDYEDAESETPLGVLMFRSLGLSTKLIKKLKARE